MHVCVREIDVVFLLGGFTRTLSDGRVIDGGRVSEAAIQAGQLSVGLGICAVHAAVVPSYTSGMMTGAPVLSLWWACVACHQLSVPDARVYLKMLVSIVPVFGQISRCELRDLRGVRDVCLSGGCANWLAMRWAVCKGRLRF